MNILITGTAGFIGFHLARRLLAEGHRVAGLDNFNDYYDPSLKEARNAILERHDAYTLHRGSLAAAGFMQQVFDTEQPDRVIHLAAQAGVRYSIDHPDSYLHSNLAGFHNILECCRHADIDHLVYASSSSVYGANRVMPFSEQHPVDHPVSLYAATKRSNELIAHSYSHLYRIPVTGLRFFTVYGPWGRPDMALFKFTRRILAGEPIDVFSHGRHERDFTFIDDIIDGVCAIAAQPPEPASAGLERPDTSNAPYRIYNIGNNRPVKLMDFIETLERALGRKAIMNFLPQQPGDVASTFADIDSLHAAVGYQPKTSIDEGIPAFTDWYLKYYQQT